MAKIKQRKAKLKRWLKSKLIVGRTIIKKSFASAWATAGPVTAFLALFWYLFRNWLPDNNPYKDVLPAAASALLFVVYASFEVWRQVLRGPEQVPVPDDTRMLEFFAHPYEAESGDLLELSEFADEFFHGDTMKADVVRDAVRKRAAIGLRLTTSDGENVGFFDVFHLRPEALLQWMKGELSEPDMGKDHFEPIPNSGATLEVIIGAIYIVSDYRSVTGLGVAFAELCQRYLWRRCAAFEEIVLYASIFTPEGERLARLYKFQKYWDKKHRTGAAKDKYDVQKLVLHADDAISVGRMGGPDQFTITMKQR